MLRDKGYPLVSGNEQTSGADKRQSPSAWFRGIGKLRDGILVFGGATYGLGYIVWSIHAWKENLGLLPALEPQYLAAGVVPMLLIWLAYFGFKRAVQLTYKVINWRTGQTGIWPTVWRILGVACLAGGSVGLAWLYTSGKRHPLSQFQVFFGTMAGSALLLSGLILWLFLSPSLIVGRSSSSGTHERGLLAEVLSLVVKGLLWSFLTGLLICAYLVLYLSFFTAMYVFVLYPAIPQEFGGVRPRCAYIDVAKDQLSVATQKEILPNAAESDGTVAQSYRMTVYFSGSEFMLARRDLGEPPAGQPKPKLFELRKEVIKAVHWCD